MPMHHNPIRIHLPAIHRALRRITESQRHIRHRKYHHPIIHLNILRNPPHPAFQHAVPIQKTHLRSGFQPNLVLCIRSQKTQALDREMKFPRFGEFTDLGSKGDQLFTLDIGGTPDQRFGYVVHPGFLEAEAVVSGV